MKMLTTFLLLCAGMALTNAAAVPEAEPDQMTGEEHIQEEELLLNLTVPEAEPHEEMSEEEPIQEDAALLFSGRCPYTWEHFNGRCYRYFSTPKTWALAESNCRALRGTLASVHNYDEESFIKGMIQKAAHGSPTPWIGASDAQQEGLWLWTDGSFFDFTNWCRGEPSNLDGRQHCLLQSYGGGNCWHDLNCYDHHPYVCARRV